MSTPSAYQVRFYRWISIGLLTGGIVLGSVVTLNAVAGVVHSYAWAQVNYLAIDTLPTVDVPLATPTWTATPTATETPTPIPSATPMPTATPTATYTATPRPLPPIRLQIPAIGVNSRVQTLDAQVTVTGEKSETWLWPDPGYVVGHYSFSGRPTEGRNVVLTGHNNWKGSVFSELYRLHAGDRITLSTADTSYLYEVVDSVIIPYRANPVHGSAELWRYLSRQEEELLTIYSCYPFATNADRIVVTAKPVEQ